MLRTPGPASVSPSGEQHQPRSQRESNARREQQGRVTQRQARGGRARVCCNECGHDYFVAFSCKLRCLCASCHTKRELIWAEWVADQLLEDVPGGVGARRSPR